METTKNYFQKLNSEKCEVEKKNGLSYISWVDGWTSLKNLHPEATYRKIKNNDTYLFRSGTGGSVECEVTVGDITYCADLAVTDHKNQEIKYEAIKSTDIQNTLQRAFAKAIAMHGIGLYVYRGEDFPEDNKESVKPKTQQQTVDTPTGATRIKYFSSNNETCPECGLVNEGKKFTKKDGTEAEGATCTGCGIKYFINRK